MSGKRRAPVTVITTCEKCGVMYRLREENGDDYCKWCGHIFTTAPSHFTAYHLPSHPIPAPGKDTESRVTT